jgi:glutamate 5-kinase
MTVRGGAGSERRALLTRARRVVVKIGSRLIADSPAGRPAALADEITALKARGLEFVVVSSGAIALGVRLLGLPGRPKELPGQQAAAAVGQNRLMQHWEHAFAAHQQRIGQVLVTHDDIAQRSRFLSARRALRALLDHGAVPIVNENDTVAVEEIKYGDNDLLAALICNLVSADALIILTDVDGLCDAPPDRGGQRIPEVTNIDLEAAPLAGTTATGGVGSGGMASKVQAAKAAARQGIGTAVVPGARPGVLAATLAGDDIGTLFVPSAERMSSRKHWLAYGPRPAGTVVVDEGARRALTDKGRSLLPAGVLEVHGNFELGDIVSLAAGDGAEFARGLAGYSAKEMRRIKGLQTADIEAALGYKYLDEVIHRDDLVLL